MASIESAGEIQYWFELIIQADQGSEEQQYLIKKIPNHLMRQISDLLKNYYSNITNKNHRDEEIKKNYKDDEVFGTEAIKDRPLRPGATKLNSAEQITPFIRGRDMEEHQQLMRGMSSLGQTVLNSYKRDTGSANQTDILPHLFKQQKWYKGIESNIDKTIAVAVEGSLNTKQVHLLTRLRHRASGSLFREMANTTFEEELQVMDKTKDPGEVMEKTMTNANPFRGKFTFHTSYGPPPTASLSQSTVSYTAIKDLGVPEYGPEFTLYNTTTGSLSSGSFLNADSAGSPYIFNGQELDASSVIPTTASVLETLRFKATSKVAYTAKWEQDITVISQTATTVEVLYRNKEYTPALFNSNMNTLFPTQKTVLRNGTIFIT